MGDETGVRITLFWIATGLIGLNLPVTVIDMVSHHGVYRPGFAWVVLGGFAVLTGLMVRRLVHGRAASGPLRAALVLACLTLAAHPWAWVDRSVYSPLLHVLVAVISVSALVSVPWSLVLVPATALWVVALRAPAPDPWQAAGEGLLLALGGFVGTAAVVVFSRAGRSVHDAVERAWLLAEQRARLAGRIAARERWDGLVHDTVLGALSLASRSAEVPPAAGDLAREALSALRDHGPSADPVARCWREHADRLGLHATVSVTGEPGRAEVRDVFAGAVNEALTNVSRHSGQTEVLVVGRFDDATAQVTVRDHGVGFEPSDQPGIGLRTSVAARMRAVGGRAEVFSSPGDGTQVALTWEAPPPGGGTDGTPWQLGSFAPVYAVSWGVLVLPVVVAHRIWSAATLPWLSWLIVAAIGAVMVAVVQVAPSRRAGAVLVATITTIAVAGAANTPTGAPPDWRYWYLSALNPALAALSYRFSGWVGGWTVAVVGVVAVVADLAAGREWWSVATQAMPVLVGTVVAAQMLRHALADAWQTVEETTRQGAMLRQALAAEAERERETQERVAALQRTVGAALERLATGSALGPGEAAELDLLGSAVRDQLAASDLLDDRLVTELRRARARRVLVDVVPAGAGQTAADDAAVGLCREVLGLVLAGAAAGSHVRVRWSAAPGEPSTVTVVGGPVGELAAGIRVLGPRAGARLAVSLDPETLLVEVVALGSGPRQDEPTRARPLRAAGPGLPG